MKRFPSAILVSTLLAVGGFGLLGGYARLQEATPARVVPDVRYTLETNIAEGKLVFLGRGGAIDGLLNPTLRAARGELVQVTLVIGDGAQHDIAFPDFEARSELVAGRGASTVVVFRADREGSFPYLCTVPGHRQAGMEGRLVVGDAPADEDEPEDEAGALASIVRNPADLPGPLGPSAAATHDLVLETVETEARLADGTTYRFWTFGGQVPGPFLRVRVGDRVNVTLRNAAHSTAIHSVDFHAVTGPGGGAAATQTKPGEETRFSFTALNPGLYVYHCATPMVAHHISNGMYGLILVEPEAGLPAVDREFYVMQGELYTDLPFGQEGKAELSVEKLLGEDPEYVVFNGAVGGLSEEHPMHARVGETVRVFFGVGGPNLTSSFHIIGEIFDRVHDQGALTSPPLTDVQTVTVPAGGSTMVEFALEVPGRYLLVDHALSRLERGLVGILHVEGAPNPEAFSGSVDGGH